MRASCVLEKQESDWCIGCGMMISGPSAWAFPVVYVRRGVRYIKVRQCCQQCAAVDAAMTEADDEGWRYTEIAAGLQDDSYNGTRCCCGGVRLVSLEMCIECSRTARMLSAAEAEARLMRKVLRELNTEIRQQLQPA